jgi:large subunit ribosomal protein L9
MKVILLQEVKNQGGEGDVIDVARGYAVNFLFPKKLAIEATKGNLTQLEARRHNIQKREAQRLDSADKVFAALNEQTIVVPARVGEEGQLFGSVTAIAVAAAIAEQLGAEIDRKRIELSAPIKKVGEYTATVTIYRDVKAVVSIKVVDEKTADSSEAEPALDATAANDVAEAVEAARDIDAEAAEALPDDANQADEAIAVEAAEDASDAIEAE